MIFVEFRALARNPYEPYTSPWGRQAAVREERTLARSHAALIVLDSRISELRYSKNFFQASALQSRRT